MIHSRLPESALGFADHPLQLIILLFLLSILPLLVVMGTSFLKLAVVLSLLRNALGVQQIPPNIAIYGLALILTLFIMAPVGFEIRERVAVEPVALEAPDFFERLDHGVLEPYRAFLRKHAAPAQVRFFASAGRELWPAHDQARLSEDSLLVMLPAFTVSQLTEAFKIGLLLYLPFIAIDLIVSNILLAMGMMMVSPMTVALPFKLLIFVLMNGWEKLIGQLLLSYV
ncbi:type III secretion system export apparatus subunit SctR [Paludibacterium yongneupense]|uniref:type III secretion system export apparatus subunit SctR n=1 Tax=Paludibacterium yongneupense TaxID=400061 RepID=UPI0006857C9B|nr:type III secretion system export apparatus subunit SctR [Paludibacterium yongneupense]